MSDEKYSPWEFEQKFVGGVYKEDPGIQVGVPGTNTYTYTDPLKYTDFTMVWSGRDVWLFSANSRYHERAVYNVWDAGNIDGEKLSYHYYFDNSTHYIRSVATRDRDPDTLRYLGLRYNTAGPGLSATVWYNRIYVAHGSVKIFEWDAESHLPTLRDITMPTITTSVLQKCSGPVPVESQQYIASNVCAAGGKLFVTTSNTTSTSQQRLCIYDLATSTWDIKVLPGRHQASHRHIVDGLDGFVWITSKNNHNIIKVDIATGDVIATVRIGRHPYRMTANQSKELFVASDGGEGGVSRKDYDAKLQGGAMSNGAAFVGNSAPAWTEKVTVDVTDGQVSVIDQQTNAQDGYAGARCNGAIKNGDLFDDGNGRMWFVTDENIGRLNKSDKELKTSFYEIPATPAEPNTPVKVPELDMIPGNSTINIDTSENTLFYASVVTPSLHYERWNGSGFETVNVKPYLFVLDIVDATDPTPTLYAYRLSALVRKNKYIHRATAMIAVGAQAYYGD